MEKIPDKLQDPCFRLSNIPSHFKTFHIRDYLDDIEFKDGGFRVKWEEKDSAVLLFESLAIATKAFEEADFGDSGIKISACKMPQSTKSVSHRKLIPKKQEKSESSAEPKPKKPENNSTDGIKEAVRPKRDTTVARRLIMASLGISGSDSNSRTSSKPEQGTRIAKDKAEIDQIIDSLQKLDVKKKNS